MTMYGRKKHTASRSIPSTQSTILEQGDLKRIYLALSNESDPKLRGKFLHYYLSYKIRTSLENYGMWIDRLRRCR
jgi:hypothetical protein